MVKLSTIDTRPDLPASVRLLWTGSVYCVRFLFLCRCTPSSRSQMWWRQTSQSVWTIGAGGTESSAGVTLWSRSSVLVSVLWMFLAASQEVGSLVFWVSFPLVRSEASPSLKQLRAAGVPWGPSLLNVCCFLGGGRLVFDGHCLHPAFCLLRMCLSLALRKRLPSEQSSLPHGQSLQSLFYRRRREWCWSCGLLPPSLTPHTLAMYWHPVLLDRTCGRFQEKSDSGLSVDNQGH